jgi:hypothetical protein
LKKRGGGGKVHKGKKTTQEKNPLRRFLNETKKKKQRLHQMRNKINKNQKKMKNMKQREKKTTKKTIQLSKNKLGTGEEKRMKEPKKKKQSNFQVQNKKCTKE